MPINTNKELEHAHRGEDLENFLHHIAWEETIQPALHTQRAAYQNMLVQSVLGTPVIDQRSNVILSKEVLAGRIDAIDWLERYFDNIIRRGNKAVESLKDEQLFINNNNR